MKLPAITLAWLLCSSALPAQTPDTAANKPKQPDVAALQLQTKLPRLFADFSEVKFARLDAAKNAQLYIRHSESCCEGEDLNDDNYYLQLAKPAEPFTLALLHPQHPAEKHVEYDFSIEGKSQQLIPLLAWPHGALQLLDRQKRVQADNLAIRCELASFALFGKQNQLEENFTLRGNIGLFLLDLADKKSSGLLQADSQTGKIEVLGHKISLQFNLEPNKVDEFGDSETATCVIKNWAGEYREKNLSKKNTLMSLCGLPLWMYEVEFFDSQQRPLKTDLEFLVIYADGRCGRSYYCEQGFEQLGGMRINYVDTIRYTTLQQQP